MSLSSTVCMHQMCASVWILTTVTGHGCRGHLVDNRPLMGGGPAQHSFSLDPLWNILLCHLPLRAYGRNNIRSPILRTQVGLTSTKQWEVHFFIRIHHFNWAISNICKQYTIRVSASSASVTHKVTTNKSIQDNKYCQYYHTVYDFVCYQGMRYNVQYSDKD